MDGNRRPISVTGLAWLYIAMGTVGFVYHFREAMLQGGLNWGAVGIEVSEATAIVAGVFMLRGANWARWLAIAWMAFHVVVGAMHGMRGFGTHVVMLIVIAWPLLRREAGEWFRGRG